MLSKPETCRGCPLYTEGTGFMQVEGQPRLGVTLAGEALGEEEAKQGGPFRGKAGFRFEKMIERAGFKREDFQIINAVWCRPMNPPNREPTEEEIDHCRQYWEHLVQRPECKVIVPMGNVPLFAALGEEGILSKRGYVWWSEKYQAYILPTVHPSFIMRGNSKWEAAFLYDIRHAVEVARDGWVPVVRDNTLDPGPHGAQGWANLAKDRLSQMEDPALGTDIETPDKSTAEDEIDINLGYLPGPIHRIGFAYVWKELTYTLSIPWDVNHLDVILFLLSLPVKQIYCPTPDQKVLTSDLRWVEAGKLVVGDKLASFDEMPDGRKTRYFKTGTVTLADRAVQKVYRITFEDGTAVKTSAEHQWLVKRVAHEMGVRTDAWVRTSDLKVGQRIRRYMEPWEEDTSKEAGYLAGFFDGEGSVHKQAKGSLVVQASQNPGPTRDHVLQLLKQKGYGITSYVNRGRKVSPFRLHGRLHNRLRFLGSIRPQRLLRKATPDYLGSLQVHAPNLRITKIEYLGPTEVVLLSVDAKTYILEGFAAHNCNRHFDVPRIKAHGHRIGGVVIDMQEMWHVLHSDLPKKLEHVAPFLVPNQPAWKHLSGAQPAFYNASDSGVQVESYYRLKALLIQHGMWELYERDIHGLNPILIYMGEQGMPVDVDKRKVASQRCMELKEGVRVKLNEAAQAARPSKTYVQARFSEGLQEIEIEKQENYCTECQKRVPGKGTKHPHFKCGTAAGEVPLGTLGQRVVKVRAWIKPLDFKPSPKGLIRYAEFKGYKLITRWDKNEGRRKTVMDETACRQYALKHPEDPLWPLVLEERELSKLLGTYIGRLTTEPEKARTQQDAWWEAFRAAENKRAYSPDPEVVQDRMPRLHKPYEYKKVSEEDDDIPF